MERFKDDPDRIPLFIKDRKEEIHIIDHMNEMEKIVSSGGKLVYLGKQINGR